MQDLPSARRRERDVQSDVNRPTLFCHMVVKNANNLGYRGRTGIRRLIVLTTPCTMVHGGASEQEMIASARLHCCGIREDGKRKDTAGVTSIEEALRVTRRIGTPAYEYVVL